MTPVWVVVLLSNYLALACTLAIALLIVYLPKTVDCRPPPSEDPDTGDHPSDADDDSSIGALSVTELVIHRVVLTRLLDEDMPSAIKGTLVECDPSIKAIILKLDSERHEYVIEDLDEQTLLVNEDKLKELKERLELELRETQQIANEESESD
ncbi:MAG: TFIIH complex subunit tfb5 [Caeruleum heppii]|nr:MAG: TFIIH complex subunit tfb5 [Caeruleum heppii]